jgi:predicted ATPase
MFLTYRKPGTVLMTAGAGLLAGAGRLQTDAGGPHERRSVSEEPSADTVIRTPDQRLRVFVSSTLGELAAERRAVSRAITALRLTPVMFEQGARPYPPRDLYRAYLAQSDVFIGLYWQRYGQAAPGMQVSGLEEELVLSRGLPRLLYVKAPAPDREPRLADLLARVRQEALVSYRGFRMPSELGRLVRDDLAVLLSERFAAARAPAPDPAPDPAPARPAAPVPARSRGLRPLPVGTTSLVGREQAMVEVAALVGRPGVRLVTLTGPGGVGKTRLAVAVGERLRDRFGAGTAFVPLAAVTDPGLVLAAVGRAVGADLAGTGPPADALAEQIGDGAWLLILDNLEQVTGAAPDLGELLARCPGVTILATSRTVLGLRAEQEYPVPPLPLPAGPATAPEAELAASPAVALFVDRARAVRPDFALTPGNAAAVAGICRRLEGLPLAIELAAARTRLLDPATLLRRLTASLDALGTGAVDLPERQQTLRATVEWSVGLLDDAERSLLETMAVFVDGWTIEAAAQVAGLDEDRALELSEALARHSLIYLDDGGVSPRSRMLETIRAFVAERLAARPDAGEIGRRHAGYYRALAERSDRPLRAAGHDALLDRLQAEAGNLAAAVRWYLGHDPAPLPHLFRVLWSFWFLREHLPEARGWVDQLLPTASSLGPQSRAELMWTAAVTANEVGDDAAALAARRNLEPLLDTIEDPFLRAVGLLALAWTSPITGDFDGARREASASLAQLRGQDEPFWTAQASADLGAVEMATGHYDDALSHLGEMHDLAERFGYPWLASWSQVLMGTIAVAQGRLDQARDQLDDVLEQGRSANFTSSVALGLIAFARLALADGDPGRAALLAGAAEGLRRRAGLQVWPVQRRGEAELVAQIRQALGASAFDEKYAAGGRFSRREAVAAARDRPGTSSPA